MASRKRRFLDSLDIIETAAPVSISVDNRFLFTNTAVEMVSMLAREWSI